MMAVYLVLHWPQEPMTEPDPSSVGPIVELEMRGPEIMGREYPVEHPFRVPLVQVGPVRLEL